MPFQDPVAWTVKYDVLKELLNPAFKGIDLIERFDCGWTLAIHRFGVFGESDGKEWRDELKKELVKLKADDFKFHFEDLGGEVTLPVHTHVISPWHEVVAFDGTAEFQIVTLEKRIKMHFAAVHQVRRGEIHDQVKTLIEENGLEVGDMEKTETPESLHTLHQPGWTNHQFVLDHLLPRAVNEKHVSGYQIFTNEGNRVSFCTPTYEAKKLNPEMEQVHTLKLYTDDWNTILTGGVTALSQGFDPFKLEKLVGLGILDPLDQLTDVQPALGIGEALRFNLYPDREQEVSDIRAASIAHRTGWLHHWFLVTLRGDKIFGSARVPFIVDMKGTKIVKDDDHQGYVVFRHHKIQNSTYDISLKCVKG